MLGIEPRSSVYQTDMLKNMDQLWTKVAKATIMFQSQTLFYHLKLEALEALFVSIFGKYELFENLSYYWLSPKKIGFRKIG